MRTPSESPHLRSGASRGLWMLAVAMVAVWCRVAMADAFDEIVRTEMAGRHLPAVAISITRGTEVLKSKGYGVANLEWKTPADEKTIFQIASLTKQFTAVAIELLAQDGRLSIDDSISKHLYNLPEAWKKITLRHLLTHTSGLKNYTALTNAGTLSLKPITAPELVQQLRDYPLEFEPGDRYAYSNTGYYLLGVVIEIASGQSYAEFLRSRIFAPLGMRSTDLNSNERVIERRAGGYYLKGETPLNAPYIDAGWAFAAGSLVSTADDMARWHIGLLEGKVLSAAVLEEMWKPAVLNDGGVSTYGFGWSIKKQHDHRILHHAGALPGFTTYNEFVPDLKLSVTVLINAENGNPERLADRLLAAADPQFEVTAVQDEHPEMTALVRKVFEGWAAGDLANAPLATRMREHLEKDLAKSSAFISSLGTLQKIEVLEQKSGPGESEFAYRVIFKDGALAARFVFNAQKQATRIEIHRD